ncbi:HTH-type transcriptional regulator CfxR [Saliniradius amylolyticus]|uniref:HTH-type transcriptional regulator CfxR n=1 Tax=Saliniradius amylolyticus TaxID=2183582 RepID=A0A2S2E0I7_9ALTE|nr:LysR family transcriptional regulator [Saliniradius amylolyticus]AWL11136.1 HTH-type transcriptional regulator CfxR [Saliniradius amylolyticus]
MKQLSLDNLRAFVAVVDMGGYARAGDYLGRSQPAISLQIKRLEEQLGRKLFHKQGQRQQLNSDGHKLYHHAVKLLSLNDDIFRQFERSPLSGKLRLGLPSEFATSLLPDIIGEFSSAYPDVTLAVTCDLSKHLLQTERRQEFDVILALRDEQELTDAAEHSVLLDELVWVGQNGAVPDTSPLPLAVAPQGCIYRRRAEHCLTGAGVDFRIGYTNADISGLTAALKAGLGLTVLARSTLPEGLTEIKHKTLPKLGKVGIELIVQRHKHPQASEKLAEFIRTRLSVIG